MNESLAIEVATALPHPSAPGTATPALVIPAGFQLRKSTKDAYVLVYSKRSVVSSNTWTLAGTLPQATLGKIASWKKLTVTAKQQRLDSLLDIVAPAFNAAMATLQQGLETFLETCAEEGLPLPKKLANRLSEGSASLLDLAAQFDPMLVQLRDTRRREQVAIAINESIQLQDYPETFPVASYKRKFIAVLGPTNSGKTHIAFERLATAESGVYLGPLRLLALEAYARLNTEFKVTTSLITGEERRINPDSKVTASTVEMLNTEKRVEVAVIDEVQLLTDPDRGWAWTQAIVGANAEEVWLLGAPAAKPALQALATRLGVDIEFRDVARKSPLHLADKALADRPAGALGRIQPGDALIVFSRRDALALRDDLLGKGLSVACIYGALSPEVREREAARFSSGEASVLVATDAIGMGLNLPIQRIVFTAVQKFDGVSRDDLPVALLQQIAGRAGRYGHHEAGTVVGLTSAEHGVVRDLMREKQVPLPTKGFTIAPNLGQLMGISLAAKEQRLAMLLTLFVQHAGRSGDGNLFVAKVPDDQLERALLLDRMEGLNLSQKHILSMAPMSTREEAIVGAWDNWSRSVAKQQPVDLRFAKSVPRIIATLGDAEQMVRLLAAYRWLAFRLPQYFPEEEAAEVLTDKWVAVVESHLKSKLKQSEARSGRNGMPAWYWEYR